MIGANFATEKRLLKINQFSVYKSMKKLAVTAMILVGALLSQLDAFAQYKPEEVQKSEAQVLMDDAMTSETPVVITLEQALEIALSENVSVKVADMEIKRAQYAKKGTYAALFPQIDEIGRAHV